MNNNVIWYKLEKKERKRQRHWKTRKFEAEILSDFF